MRVCVCVCVCVCWIARLFWLHASAQTLSPTLHLLSELLTNITEEASTNSSTWQRPARAPTAPAASLITVSRSQRQLSNVKSAYKSSFGAQ